MEWGSARHFSLASNIIITCRVNSSGRLQSSQACRTTLQARCHLPSQDRVTTSCYSISTVSIPSLTGSSICMVIFCWSALGFTAYGPPHSDKRISAPWVQMYLGFCSNKHPPFQREAAFLSAGSREPNIAHTSSLVLEASWRHSYESIGSSGL